FEPYSERFDFILFMATTPGRSGGYFDKSNFKKIRQFKSIYPSKGIHVDGGVNGEVSFILRNLGVDTAVAGSYLFKESDLGIAMLNLKVNEVDSQYKLKDFMRCSDEIPMLHRDSATLHNVLHSIEDYKLGFTLVINDNGHLDGIITNADVRKGLLKNLDNLNKTLLEDMLNRTPFTANENHTVIELLNLVKKQKFPVSYLPVVNDSNKLTGAITFVNLIKGEL
ncbi:MAG: CBS domain-containing protein, partial [Bacteroidia bacterium]|nr:CBS domain-containing protein [Bacteroidia bacterium]